MRAMSDERKPLWPWIAALLIGLPLLYVVSFGPACWVTSRSNVTRHEFLDSIYWPLGHVMYEGWPVLTPALAWLAETGMPAGHRLFLRTHVHRDDGGFVLIGHGVF